VHSMIGGGERLADVGGISLGALLDDKGGCFGGFASGGDGGRPPAVPAEFVRLMSGAIGPLIAAAWRNLKLATLAETTQFWLSGVCEDALESAEWIVGAGDPAGDHLMPISDAEGRKLGSVVLKVKAGAQLNAFMEEMIKVTAELLQLAADDVLALGMGDGEPTWLPDGMKGQKGLRNGKLAARMALPGRLMGYGRKLVGELTKDLISELKSYNSPPEAVFRVMSSVVLLVDRVKLGKDLGEWKDCKPKIDMDLVKECSAFDASLKGHKRQWVECRKASKGLTSDEVLKRGSAAVQSFQKWVEVQRLVRHISQELRKEAKAEAEGDDDADEEEEEEEEEEE